jgi:hypothetical protein
LIDAVPDVGRQQRHEHTDQRGLAGAVGTEEPEDFPGFHLEGDAVDGGEVAELLDDAVDFDGAHDWEGVSGSST